MSKRSKPILQQAFDDGRVAGLNEGRAYAGQLSQHNFDEGYERGRRQAEFERSGDFRSGVICGLSVMLLIVAAFAGNFGVLTALGGCFQ